MKTGVLFLKFALVGVLNTLFGYSIYALLLFLGLHYAICVVLSTIAGILFNFKTTGVLVFKNHNNRLLLKFFINYLFVCILSILILKCANILNLNLYYAGLFSTGVCAVISFFISKNWVFKE